MWPNPHETANLVTFTEEILNGKLPFLCSDSSTFDFLQGSEYIYDFITLHSVFFEYFGIVQIRNWSQVSSH